MAPSSTHRCSSCYIATRTEWNTKRISIMKAKVIGTFLLSTVSASEPASPQYDLRCSQFIRGWIAKRQDGRNWT